MNKWLIETTRNGLRMLSWHYMSDLRNTTKNSSSRTQDVMRTGTKNVDLD